MTHKNYSRDIAAAVEEFMQEDDMHYTFHEGSGVFQFGMKISGKLHTLSCAVDVGMDDYQVFGICPVGVETEDREMLQNMALFLSRVNYSLKNGSFQLDCSDGEIRYHVYADCDGGVPSAKQIRNSITVTCMMVSRYAAGITGIIYSGLNPEEAEEKCRTETDPIMQFLQQRLQELLEKERTAEEE